MKSPLKVILLCSFCGWQVLSQEKATSAKKVFLAKDVTLAKKVTLAEKVSIGLNLAKSFPLTMTFKEGRITNAEFILKTTVPTIYQCAEICLLLSACSHFNFVKRNNDNCFIIKNKDHNYKPANDEKDYKYMAKGNIPQELAGSCANHTCGEYETCVRYGYSKHMCKSFYQCADSVIGPANNCTDYGVVGGCDKNNIGKDLTKDGVVVYKKWSLYNWIDMITFCNRTCKQCL